jgi:hypothetical protein
MNRRERRAAKAQDKMHFANYAEMAVWMATSGRGKAHHVMVLHDRGCTPSVCTCEPEYIVEPLTTESYLAGHAAQVAWEKETVS